MADDQNLTRRHRLQGFDYSTPGYYFVTICTHQRQQLLGRISDGEHTLSPAGIVVKDTILELPSPFTDVSVDCYVVMPNHAHLLFYLPIDKPPVSVSDLVSWIKGVTTSKYGKGVRENSWPAYREHFWQKGFNDQILRNEEHLYQVRKYIGENPLKWELDEMFE